MAQTEQQIMQKKSKGRTGADDKSKAKKRYLVSIANKSRDYRIQLIHDRYARPT